MTTFDFQEGEQHYRVMRLNRNPSVGPSHPTPWNAATASPTPTPTPSHLHHHNGTDNNPVSSALQYCTPCMGSLENTERHRTRKAAVKGMRAAAVHIERGSARVRDEPCLLFAGRRPAPNGVSTAMQQHVHLFQNPVRRDTTTTTTSSSEGGRSSISTPSVTLAMSSTHTGSVTHCREARLAMLSGNGPLW